MKGNGISFMVLTAVKNDIEKKSTITSFHKTFSLWVWINHRPYCQQVSSFQWKTSWEHNGTILDKSNQNCLHVYIPLEVCKNGLFLFFVIWVNQPLNFSFCNLNWSALSLIFSQADLHFIHLHLSSSLSSFCFPASFSGPSLLHTCAEITGRMLGSIDFWSCEMTSLVSDHPVYIWFTASCLWSQREGGNRE